MGTKLHGKEPCVIFEEEIIAPMIDIPTSLSPTDLTHCLRPTFTQTLWHHVFTRPKSLNLIGSAGKGKTRQLEDLREIATRYQIPTALVNIHDFRKDYTSFLSKIATQLDLQTTVFSSFADLLTVLYQTFKDRVCLVMIDEIEVLNDYAGNDELYDHQFIAGINHLKNSQEVRLLCASREWLKSVHFNGNTSFPELAQQDLPTVINDAEIEAEIIRQAPQIALPAHREMIRKKVREEVDAYRLLAYLLRKANADYAPNTFKPKTLQTWYDAYRKQYARV